MTKVSKLKLIKSLIILSCFLGIVFVFSSFSSSSETEREEDVRYDVKDDEIILNLDAVEREYISSSKINSIDKINFNLDAEGKPLDSEKLSTLKYNPEGFLTETIIYNDEGGVKFSFTYDYDSKGLRTRTSRYINNKLTNYYTYEYNEFGNKTKAFRYNTEDELEEYYIYEYDTEGNLVEEEWFSPEGKKVYNIENDYDNNVKTRSYTYDESGHLVFEYLFRYDDKGNVIEEIRYDNSGLQTGIIQYIYKYF
ncbi:MAG: hypothetical protein EHM47_15395 [Ignavibacteriales bacterium]|nr:MAG: hypothetical protein EHM47_15395 [Ignavibacteriales bacterium]